MRRLLPKSTEARFVLGIVAVIVGLNLIAVLGDALVPSPGGPRSSAFATAPEGVAAWAELARRSGVPVRVLRKRPSDASLPPGGTVVVLDPDQFSSGQALALRRFAERGGRVVAGGLEPGSWLDVLNPPPGWADGGDEDARVLVPSAVTGTAVDVRTAGEGHWASPRDAVPVVGGPGGPIIVVRRVGNGLQLQPRSGGSVPGRRRGGGPLVFVEGVHGYGTTTGLAALPARFRWALVLLGLSALVLIVARWPRLGPPEAPDEPLFPPRRAYVDAMAATLARVRVRTAVAEAVRSAGRERLARRAALARDANAETWTAAARAAGLTDEEARALQDVTDDDGIAAGRALARLSRR